MSTRQIDEFSEFVTFFPSLTPQHSWIDAFIRELGPTTQSEKHRRAVYCFVRKIIIETLAEINITPTVFRYGSMPLMTYLPDGDIDVGFAIYDENGVLDEETKSHHYLDKIYQRFVQLSQETNRNNTSSSFPFPVRDPITINAEVKVIKCLVGGIAVDISANKLGGCCSFVLLDSFDRWIGRNHLFKRSILLAKAWCAYESYTLGSRSGLLATYAVEVLVLAAIHEHAHQVKTPLDVFRKFLEYVANFPWDTHAVTILGPIPFKHLTATHNDQDNNNSNKNKIENSQNGAAAHEMKAGDARSRRAIISCPEEEALRLRPKGPLPWSKKWLHFANKCRNMFKSVYGEYGSIPSVPSGGLLAPQVIATYSRKRVFPMKLLNIVDPLHPRNNLGRSVSLTSFHRILEAVKLGHRILESSLKAGCPSQLGARTFSTTLSHLRTGTLTGKGVVLKHAQLVHNHQKAKNITPLVVSTTRKDDDNENNNNSVVLPFPSMVFATSLNAPPLGSLAKGLESWTATNEASHAVACAIPLFKKKGGDTMRVFNLFKADLKEKLHIWMLCLSMTKKQQLITTLSPRTSAKTALDDEKKQTDNASFYSLPSVAAVEPPVAAATSSESKTDNNNNSIVSSMGSPVLVAKSSADHPSYGEDDDDGYSSYYYCSYDEDGTLTSTTSSCFCSEDNNNNNNNEGCFFSSDDDNDEDSYNRGEGRFRIPNQLLKRLGDSSFESVQRARTAEFLNEHAAEFLEDESVPESPKVSQMTEEWLVEQYSGKNENNNNVTAALSPMNTSSTAAILMNSLSSANVAQLIDNIHEAQKTLVGHMQNNNNNNQQQQQQASRHHHNHNHNHHHHISTPHNNNNNPPAQSIIAGGNNNNNNLVYLQQQQMLKGLVDENNNNNSGDAQQQALQRLVSAAMHQQRLLYQQQIAQHVLQQQYAALAAAAALAVNGNNNDNNNSNNNLLLHHYQQQLNAAAAAAAAVAQQQQHLVNSSNNNNNNSGQYGNNNNSDGSVPLLPLPTLGGGSRESGCGGQLVFIVNT